MHLTQLPSGTWRVAVKYGGRRRTATARTKGEARRRGAELLLELGGKVDDADVTVADMLAAHLADRDPNGAHDPDRWAPTYHHDASAVVERLVDEHQTFTRRRIRDVDPAVLLGLYRELERAGWSRWRMKRLHTVLGTAWKMAIAYGWTTASPCVPVKPPTPPSPALHLPTGEQVAAILDRLGELDRIAIRINATLGIRRGDLVGIQWGDLDLERAELFVGRSLAYVPGRGLIEMPTKAGKRSHRVLALDLPTVALLRRRLAVEREKAIANGLPEPRWVFSDDAGVTPWRPDRVSRLFRRVADRAGVTGVRLHDLRHWVATSMLEDGESLHDVAGQLGNTPGTVEDRYRHWLPGRGRESVTRRAQRLGG